MNLQHRAALVVRRAALCFALPALVYSAGCRSNCDLVERQNHQLEVALRDAHAEVMRSRAYNEALEHELSTVRTVPPPERPLPEVAAQHYSLKSISLTRQTGGVNTDGHLGDDAVQVVVEPKDVDDHPIKAPGSLFVEVSEVNTEGNKRPISNWLVAPEQLRSRWKSGFLSNGYFVTLPWRTWPETEKVRVAVKFILPDGRTFEDEKTVMVKPRPHAQRTTLPVDPTDGPQLDTPLPPPRKLEVPPPVDGPTLDSGTRNLTPASASRDVSGDPVSVELGTPQTPK